MRPTKTESSHKTTTPAAFVDPDLGEMWRKFGAAFNRFDPREVAAFWEEDGTLIGPTGTWGVGRSGVEKVYATDVATILHGSTSTFTAENVRMLGADMALLDLSHVIEGATIPGRSSGTLKLHVVALARRKGREWMLVDVRPHAYMPQAPAAQTH